MRTPPSFARHCLLVLASALPMALGACCLFCTCPTPGFVGVPEHIERSDDFELPLDGARRRALVAFLVHGDRRVPPGWQPEDEDPGRLAAIEQRFKALLDLLMQPVDDAALGSAGAIARLGEPPGRVLSVHDARAVEDDLDPGLVSAIVRDGFVFAFYWRRFTATPAPDGGVAWRLGRPGPGLRTAVCVFKSTFAVPQAAP